jgi:hypothetical protein
MKRFMPVFLFLLLFAAPSFAQVRWGAHVGVTDGSGMIGGDVVLPLGNGFYFNPNVELSRKLITTNADFHYDISISRDTAYWLGAGAALVNPDGGDLDAGANIIFGLAVRQAPRIFYTQLKYTIASNDNSFTTASFGVRF